MIKRHKIGGILELQERVEMGVALSNRCFRCKTLECDKCSTTKIMNLYKINKLEKKD